MSILERVEIESWLNDGVVCLRKIFNLKWLKILEQGFHESIETPSILSKNYAGDEKGSFFTDHAMHRRIEPINNFIRESPVGILAASLMSARKVNLVDDHLLLKEPGTQIPTYWHQDQPYFNFDGEDFCSIWIPIDAVDKNNGTMKFVKGSHKWGKQFHPIRIGVGDMVESAEDFDGAAPDIEANLSKYDVLSWNLLPGDCLAFHGKMLHAAYPNVSLDKQRRALSVRLTGDDIVWAPKRYAPTESNLPKLIPGKSIDCSDYPVLWSNS